MEQAKRSKMKMYRVTEEQDKYLKLFLIDKGTTFQKYLEETLEVELNKFIEIQKQRDAIFYTDSIEN